MQRARLLVVDDSPEFRSSMARFLATRGDEVRVARNGAEGLEIAESFGPHCILLDYVMPGMTGEEFVARIRQRDQTTQIILVTGHSGEHPAREMMQRLDIQGYHAKSADLEPLMVWIDAALKAHNRLTRLARQSEALRRIVESGPSIHRFQSRSELCQIALEQLGAVIGVTDPPVRAAIATVDADDALVIRAVSGGLGQVRWPEQLPVELGTALTNAVRDRTGNLSGRVVSLPMLTGDGCLGAIALEAPDEVETLREPLLLFANQVGLAIRSARLHEIGTVDSLTQLHSRGHLLERLDEWLRLSVREHHSLSIVFVDLDNLKTINDRFGHLAGDASLAWFGAQIRRVIRETDIAGRFGGDEFLVVAPYTGPGGAAILAERLRATIAAAPAELPGERVELTASVAYAGFTMLPLADWMRRRLPQAVWTELSRSFISLADEALYAAKAAGRNQVAPAGRAGAVDDRLVEIAQRLEAAS